MLSLLSNGRAAIPRLPKVRARTAFLPRGSGKAEGRRSGRGAAASHRAGAPRHGPEGARHRGVAGRNPGVPRLGRAAAQHLAAGPLKRRAPVRPQPVARCRRPSPGQDPAAAVVGPQVVTLLGGLDSSDRSRPAIQRLSSGSATSLGTLQTPVHDAAAVRLGSAVYLFGGGQSSSVSSIVRLDPATGQTQPAGSLPQPDSDLGAAAINGTAYLVGGYT